MKRVLVIGNCGAGKSTFSRKLQKITGLKLIHLDQEYWLPNWTETPEAEWQEKLQQLISGEQWIIDGNFGSSMDMRIERCDTVIYLDYPTLKCLWRISKRIWKYRGKERPEMPKGCREKFDLSFYHYVATFNITRGKAQRKKMEKVKENKTVYILKNDRQVSRFLAQLSQKYKNS